MSDICIDDATYYDVEIKHRESLIKAFDKLSKVFKDDDWSLTVYKEDTTQYNNFGKCVLMYWTDPYTLKFGVNKDDSYRFEICDSTWDTTVMSRRVKYEDMCSGEIDFFIDSIKEYFVIQNKLRKFTTNYRISCLPDGYKRNEKIEQLLS